MLFDCAAKNIFQLQYFLMMIVINTRFTFTIYKYVRLSQKMSRNIYDISKYYYTSKQVTYNQRSSHSL